MLAAAELCDKGFYSRACRAWGGSQGQGGKDTEGNIGFERENPNRSGSKIRSVPAGNSCDPGHRKKGPPPNFGSRLSRRKLPMTTTIRDCDPEECDLEDRGPLLRLCPPGFLQPGAEGGRGS